MRCFLGVCLAFLHCFLWAQEAPNLTLANVYQQGVDVSHYWLSEKYDGVRGYWDGKQLLTRQGNVIEASEDFLQQLPDFALDGELWFGRGQFERASGLVKRTSQHPEFDQEWLEVKYMVFDAPSTTGDFKQRYARLQQLKKRERPNVFAVEQSPIKSHSELMQQLQAISALGAEGLMLRKIDAPYRGGRSDDLLKVKLWQDTEGRVIEHLAGKGKYQGMLGALLLVLDDGRTVRVGTGFSDAERANPPAIGTRVTFKYQGETRNGLPRFPVYWRERHEP